MYDKSATTTLSNDSNRLDEFASLSSEVQREMLENRHYDREKFPKEGRPSNFPRRRPSPRIRQTRDLVDINQLSRDEQKDILQRMAMKGIKPLADATKRDELVSFHTLSKPQQQEILLGTNKKVSTPSKLEDYRLMPPQRQKEIREKNAALSSSSSSVLKKVNSEKKHSFASNRMMEKIKFDAHRDSVDRSPVGNFRSALLFGENQQEKPLDCHHTEPDEKGNALDHLQRRHPRFYESILPLVPTLKDLQRDRPDMHMLLLVPSEMQMEGIERALREQMKYSREEIANIFAYHIVLCPEAEPYETKDGGLYAYRTLLGMDLKMRVIRCNQEFLVEDRLVAIRERFFRDHIYTIDGSLWEVLIGKYQLYEEQRRERDEVLHAIHNRLLLQDPDEWYTHVPARVRVEPVEEQNITLTQSQMQAVSPSAPFKTAALQKLGNAMLRADYVGAKSLADYVDLECGACDRHRRKVRDQFTEEKKQEQEQIEEERERSMMMVRPVLLKIYDTEQLYKKYKESKLNASEFFPEYRSCALGVDKEPLSLRMKQDLVMTEYTLTKEMQIHKSDLMDRLSVLTFRQSGLSDESARFTSVTLRLSSKEKNADCQVYKSKNEDILLRFANNQLTSVCINHGSQQLDKQSYKAPSFASSGDLSDALSMALSLDKTQFASLSKKDMNYEQFVDFVVPLSEGRLRKWYESSKEAVAGKRIELTVSDPPAMDDFTEVEGSRQSTTVRALVMPHGKTKSVFSLGKGTKRYAVTRRDYTNDAGKRLVEFTFTGDKISFYKLVQSKKSNVLVLQLKEMKRGGGDDDDEKYKSKSYSFLVKDLEGFDPQNTYRGRDSKGNVFYFQLKSGNVEKLYVEYTSGDREMHAMFGAPLANGGAKKYGRNRDDDDDDDDDYGKMAMRRHNALIMDETPDLKDYQMVQGSLTRTMVRVLIVNERERRNKNAQLHRGWKQFVVERRAYRGDNDELLDVYDFMREGISFRKLVQDKKENTLLLELSPESGDGRAHRLKNYNFHVADPDNFDPDGVYSARVAEGATFYFKLRNGYVDRFYVLRPGGGGGGGGGEMKSKLSTFNDYESYEESDTDDFMDNPFKLVVDEAPDVSDYVREEREEATVMSAVVPGYDGMIEKVSMTRHISQRDVYTRGDEHMVRYVIPVGIRGLEKVARLRGAQLLALQLEDNRRRMWKLAFTFADANDFRGDGTYSAMIRRGVTLYVKLEKSVIKTIYILMRRRDGDSSSSSTGQMKMKKMDCERGGRRYNDDGSEYRTRDDRKKYYDDYKEDKEEEEMGFSSQIMKNGKLSFERKFAHFFYREAKELNAADLSPEKVRARIDAFNRAMQKQLKKNKKCLEFLADLRQVIQQYCAKERVELVQTLTLKSGSFCHCSVSGACRCKQAGQTSASNHLGKSSREYCERLFSNFYLQATKDFPEVVFTDSSLSVYTTEPESLHFDATKTFQYLLEEYKNANAGVAVTTKLRQYITILDQIFCQIGAALK